MTAIVLMGPLAQESSAAHRQRRTLAWVVGWGTFVASILLMAGCTFLAREHGLAIQSAIAVIAMAVSAILYTGRTDFTR
jgi:hypothetical protein